MDYSQLSDFEINKRVAEVIYKDRDGLFVARNIHGREEITIVAEVNSEDICIAAADYCNNPADAWPIIESNFIALHPLKHKSVWIAMSDDQEHTVRDEKPLRAAMIIFLMSKESFNA